MIRPAADGTGELKASLGYNTMLPPQYEQVKPGNLHAHTHSIKEIEAYASKLSPKEKANLRVLSFGDEIYATRFVKRRAATPREVRSG